MVLDPVKDTGIALRDLACERQWILSRNCNDISDDYHDVDKLKSQY